MVWGKAGSQTLTTSGDVITSGTITASKFNQFMCHNFNVSGLLNSHVRLDNNSNSDYAFRESTNGGTDATTINNTEGMELREEGSTADRFSVFYIVNISGEEKLQIAFTLDNESNGAGNAPNRFELVGKTDITTNSGQFTRIDVVNTDASSYDTDSNLSVLGSDLTPAPAVTFPSDVPYYTRFEETDTRKIYHYKEQSPIVDYDMSTDPRINTWIYQSNMSLTHVSDTLKIDCTAGTSGNGGFTTYFDLGKPLSNKFLLRFKTEHTGTQTYANNSHNFVGLSSVEPTGLGAIGTTNWVGGRWYYATQFPTATHQGIEPRIQVSANNGSHNNSTSVARLFNKPTTGSYGGIFWHEYIWNIDTLTFNLYDNANYTGTPIATATLNASTNTQWISGTPSNISGLQYLVWWSSPDNAYGTWNMKLDDVLVWDGVTSIPTGNVWKEIGT